MEKSDKKKSGKKKSGKKKSGFQISQNAKYYAGKITGAIFMMWLVRYVLTGRIF